MNKYSKLLTALFLAQGIVLTGCGGGGGDDDNSSSSSVDSSSSSSSESSVSSSSSVNSSVSSSVDSSSSSSSSSSVGEEESPWTMVWNDEFNGETIDTTKWSHEINCDGGGNNELQCYTDSSYNSYVEEGKLHIFASDLNAEGDVQYTSARLRSLDKGDWKYGRFEISAKMPQGQGIWPAIWMLPSEWQYGIWPMSGEIDIFEAVNPNASHGNAIHGTLHYGSQWPGQKNSGQEYVPEPKIWEDFHTYAIEWEEGEIRWYFDDIHFATQTQDGWYTYYHGGQEVGFKLGEAAAPFDQKFHLLLNVAIGGNWPGNPDVSTEFSKEKTEMVVDYVRVYKCSVDSETGKGCATNVDPEVEVVPGHSAPAQNVFTLYADGPATLVLDAMGTEVNNTLVPTIYNPGGGVSFDPGMNVDGDIVWDIYLDGQGSVQLTTGDMEAVEGINDGFKFTNMTITGELKFDLLVEAIDEDAELHVKVDSGAPWPKVSHLPIEVPMVGEWTSVSVPFKDLLPTAGGVVDFNAVIQPFVLEAVNGTAHVKVDDIRITCLAECGLDPVYADVSDVLEDDVDLLVDARAGVNWDIGIDKYVDGDPGHITISTVEDIDRGDVTEVSFSDAANTVNGLMFVKSSTPKDLSAFAGTDSYLTFDLKVLSYGTNTSGLIVKMENAAGSAAPPGTGDHVIDSPDLNTWTTIEVPIDDLLAHADAAFDITKVVTPFAFFPVWEDQSGVSFQLDNVRLIKGEGEVSEPEPNETLTDTFNILIDGEPDARWDNGIGIFQTDGGAAGHIEVLTIVDPETSTHATGIIYSETDGINSMVFVESSTPKDLSAFATNGGYLEFDIKLWSYGLEGARIVVKMESGPDEGTGDYFLDTLTPEVWTTVQVPIADMIAQPGTKPVFDISDVEKPFVILAEWDKQRGVEFDIDNVRWVVPAP